jgi:hypothetical protein
VACAAPVASFASRYHRRFGWLGFAALLMFGLSGLSHPLMTWFGPSQAAFFPPQARFDAGEISAIPGVLSANGIDSAQVVKLLPGPDGNLLQVSNGDGASRRYFDLASGAERDDFDRRQALWLARYYTGLKNAPVRAMALVTGFDEAYPAVNRLLPVWRVAFDTGDSLTAHVHTELNALASLGDNTRGLQQSLFQALHSWTWLEVAEPLRVAVLLSLCLALAAMAGTGIALAFALSSRTLRDPGRRWHRHLSWVMWLPLLAFSLSGIYHLLHNTGRPPARLVYGPTMDLTGVGAPREIDPRTPLNSISLVAEPGGELLYRLGEPAGGSGGHIGHHQRFAGTATEKPSRLVSAATGTPSSLDDRRLARLAAARHMGVGDSQLGETTLVTGFDAEYDFRNKRLPVWRVAHGGRAAFIDPASGAVVDVIDAGDRREGAVFSQLHKWNLLTPRLGRQGRDLLVVVIVASLLAMGTLGAAMAWRPRRRRVRRTADGVLPGGGDDNGKDKVAGGALP